MWFVYVLLCQDNSLYTGISPDPAARLLKHQQGKGAKYTKSHQPLKIVYTERCAGRSEALKRELEIKSWTRVKKIANLQIKL